MRYKSSLLEHCKPCGSKCCVGQSGAPKVLLKEKIMLEQRFGKGRFTKEKGYWVPRKESGECIFLKEGLCEMQEIKLVDCRMFPLDPIFDRDGKVDFVIDESCPAALHLTPEFYANSLVLGVRWMAESEVEAHHNYWKKFKANNSEQKLVSLAEYLRSRSSGLVSEIKRELERILATDLERWLKLNNAERLSFILNDLRT